MQKIKCAIYTRKSTEHGLELEFNSLQNQEESCKAYIASQAFNGWEYVKTYSDAAISGGTMYRPALQQMLTDMAHGLINTVVVYKVDRLSRSILDFHKMMQYFEKHNANFVSITQSFDTSNSMGKLTLNMLLSFAQFEREVSSERVRDKLYASKAKGMWIGGLPTLGYNLEDKKLVINPTEAETVKHLFEKYLELESVVELAQYARKNGIKNKYWITQNGTPHGGGELYPSILHRILRDKVYIGKITHKKTNEVFDGIHKPILTQELFDQVQKVLEKNANHRHKNTRSSANLLSRKLFDANGRRFINQMTLNRGKGDKYYYAIPGFYMSAPTVDEIVSTKITEFLNSDMNTLPESTKTILKSIDINTMLFEHKRELFRTLIEKVIYTNNLLTIYLNTTNENLTQYSTTGFINQNFNTMDYTIVNNTIIIKAPIIIRKTNHNNAITVTHNNHLIMHAIATAFKYRKIYEQTGSITQIMKSDKISNRTAYRYLSIAYMNPNVLNEIMDGKLGCSVDELYALAAKNQL